MQRRELLKAGAAVMGGLAVDSLAQGNAAAVPIIDTHIHMFDTGRKGGVPWPEKSDSIYKPALPDRFEKLARPFGVVGAIVIEASPLPGDNDWVLNLAASHPVLVGMVGDLVPGTPTYERELDRLHANPLFLGLRYGNIWDRDLAVDMQKPGFIDGLRMLAARGLVFDSANPDLSLIRAIAGVAGHVPDLRIVIDHLPTVKLPTLPAEREEYGSLLRTLAQNKNVFVKLSEVIAARTEQNGGPGFAHHTLDALWDVFGEDHVLYASDWPNSDHHATYAETITIVREYVRGKGPTAPEKFFWRNSVAAYRWRQRQPDQPVV